MTLHVGRYLRTALTLAVLAILLVFGVARGLDAVTQPFPKHAAPPVCVDTDVDPGDTLRPPVVTVSVVNAGTRSGLAGATLTDLEAKGFAAGEIDNDRQRGVKGAQIWTTTNKSAAVRLVRSYLGGQVQVVQKDSSVAGITVVVGDQFPGIKKGRDHVKVAHPEAVCGPADITQVN